MAKLKLNEYSVKVKIPWWVRPSDSDYLRDTFDYTLRGFTNKKFTVTARVYRCALKCRFTVIFQDHQREPDIIDALIEKVAQKTMLYVATDKTKKNRLC